MREIKFRIWHEGAKKYFDLDEVHISPIDRLLCVEADRWPDENPVLVIEQYTGLKEKRGVEIYEGAICRDIEEFHVGEVSQKKNGVWLWGDEELADFAHILEIIGNIHQHPELLEQPK